MSTDERRTRPPESAESLVKAYADERVGAIWGYEQDAMVRRTLTRFAKWLDQRAVGDRLDGAPRDSLEKLAQRWRDAAKAQSFANVRRVLEGCADELQASLGRVSPPEDL